MSNRSSISFYKIIILFILLVTAVLASLLFGAQKISFMDIINKGASKYGHTIFMKIRFPRTILALLTGMLLAGAGAVSQLFYRNSLAEPGIMGITSGATLGAVTASVFSTSRILAGTISAVSAGAFAGALIAGILVLLISSRKTGPQSTTALLLCGTALGTLYSALTSLLLAMHDKQLVKMYAWMMGSFNGKGWSEVRFIALPSVIALIMLIVCAKDLDLLNTGESTAASLGLNIRRLRTSVMIACSLSCCAAVCAGGTIGFAGLIAPHITRRIFGSQSRSLVPLSMVTGAIILTASDTLCRIIMPPSEVPVGIIMSLLGSPFFIALIFSRQGLKNG